MRTKPFPPQFVNVTGASALAASIAAADDETPFLVRGFRLHLSAAGASGNLTVKVNSAKGSEYDTILLTQDMTSITDLVNTTEVYLAAGDTLDFAWANAGTKTYGLTVIKEDFA